MKKLIAFLMIGAMFALVEAPVSAKAPPGVSVYVPVVKADFQKCNVGPVDSYCIENVGVYGNVFSTTLEQAYAETVNQIIVLPSEKKVSPGVVCRSGCIMDVSLLTSINYTLCKYESDMINGNNHYSQLGYSCWS